MRKANCAACKVSCPFSSLPLAERSQLSSLIHHQLSKKGEVVFEQGAMISGFYLLCDGKVKLVRYTSMGRKQIVKLLNTGDIFGESGLLEARAASISAWALADSVVGWLSLGDFQELMKRFPALALALQKKLADEIEDLRVRLTEQACLGTRERLIKLLLELGEKYGSKSDD